jgi:transglutaminase/protease-like cytokinesis protein 3
MKNIFLILSFFFYLLSFGQANVGFALVDAKMTAIPANATNSTEAIAKYINANFKTENDKIRAVFYWTASNISYDVENMFAVNSTETPQDRITKTFRTRKGICGDYATIFSEIANLVGVKTVVVEGYTKQYGKVATLAHAWCAAEIENKWYLFDPTWGSGYVNNNKYTRKINNGYFKVAPSKMINSHMPFDYLWQFNNYPITNQEFIDGKIQINKTKKNFDFESEIKKYEALPKIDQLFESAQRIEKNGIKNQLISQAYTYKKSSWNTKRQNENGAKYNAIVNNYNEAINDLNDFIYYRNNKFKPVLSDDEIKSKIQNPIQKLEKCQESLFRIGSMGSENANSLSDLKKSIANALIQSEAHLDFVNNYLSKSKLVRKTIFSKVSWFGVPLN